MSFGCLSAFSRKARGQYDDPPMTPKSTCSFDAGAQPKKSAIRRSTDSPSCSHSILSRANSGGDYIQVLQAFRGQAQDELTVSVGQRLKVLYVEGEWAYVSGCSGSTDGVPERCGFVPTNFCKRLTLDRNVKFADDGDNARTALKTTDSISSSSSGKHGSQRSTSLPNANISPFEDLGESDYVALRAPTQTEKNIVGAGYPYTTTVLYNFSDDAIDRVCVRRGEDVTVLGRDVMDTSWTMIHRSNGQQGLVPTCFLQSPQPEASLPSTPAGRHYARSNSSSIGMHASAPRMHSNIGRGGAGGSGGSVGGGGSDNGSILADSVIYYPSVAVKPRSPAAEVADWVKEVAQYGNTSPGHSASSSDSGYAVVGNSGSRSNGTPQTGMERGCTSRSSSCSPEKPMPRSTSTPIPSSAVHKISLQGKSAKAMLCTPTSSADSGNCHDDAFEFPPPPPECAMGAVYDEVDSAPLRKSEVDSAPLRKSEVDSAPLRKSEVDSAPLRKSGRGQRKLAQRRPLGPKTPVKVNDSKAVNALADQLVQLAASHAKTPVQTPAKLAAKQEDVPERKTPPAVAPKPKSSSPRPKSTSPKPQPLTPKPTHRSPSPQSGSPHDEPQESCLLVLSQFTADNPNKLSVEKGDIVYGDTSLAGESRGWVWAYSERQDKHGFIPVVYVQQCNADGVGGVVTEI